MGKGQDTHAAVASEEEQHNTVVNSEMRCVSLDFILLGLPTNLLWKQHHYHHVAVCIDNCSDAVDAIVKNYLDSYLLALIQQSV